MPATILNGTIAAGMVVLIRRCRTARASRDDLQCRSGSNWENRLQLTWHSITARSAELATVANVRRQKRSPARHFGGCISAGRDL